MTRWRLTAALDWPLDDVVSVQRDRLSRLAAYLDPVDHVEELSRDVTPGRVVAMRRWSLSRDAFPPGLRGLLPDDAMGFDDRVDWQGDRVTFEVMPHAHADAVSCIGVIRLVDDGPSATLIEVEGVFGLLDKAQRVLPEAFRARGIPAIEAAVVATMRSHFQLACRAVDDILTDEL